MADEDLSEMASLRRASQFRAHEHRYGSRSEIKQIREQREAEMEKQAEIRRQQREKEKNLEQQEDEIRKYEAEHANDPDTDDEDLDGGPPKRMRQDDDDDVTDLTRRAKMDEKKAGKEAAMSYDADVVIPDGPVKSSKAATSTATAKTGGITFGVKKQPVKSAISFSIQKSVPSTSSSSSSTSTSTSASSDSASSTSKWSAITPEEIEATKKQYEAKMEAEKAEKKRATVAERPHEDGDDMKSEPSTSTSISFPSSAPSEDDDDEAAAMRAMGFATTFGAKPKAKIDLVQESEKRKRKELEKKKNEDSSMSTSSTSSSSSSASSSSSSSSTSTTKPSTSSTSSHPSRSRPSTSTSTSTSDADLRMLEEREAKRKAKLRAKGIQDVDADDDVDVDDDDESTNDMNNDIEPQPSEEDDTSARSQAIIDQYKLPITHEIELSGSTRAVTALTVDRAGARVVAGGSDYMMNMYDFGGMNTSMSPFRQIEVQEGHQIVDLQYSNTGDSLLACTGGAQPKLYDREGHELCQFVRGDMYIMDQKHTKGHISGVTSGCWHPTDRHRVMTSGSDGTIRLWDVNDVTKNLEVVKLRLQRGTKVTAACFSPDGKSIASVASDGSIQLFRHNMKQSRADKYLANAHIPGSETSSILYGQGEYPHLIITRGGDHTLKIWDQRNFKLPTHAFGDLENSYGQTSVIWSPEERLLVTATSTKDNDSDRGSLVFIDARKMERILSVGVTEKSAIRVVWHPILNQIVVGSSDAKTRVLYNPSRSTRGALMCLGRRVKAKDPSDFQEHMVIHTPHALPLFRETVTKRKYERIIKDPKLAKIPQLPVEGTKGVGGRAGSTNITQFMMRQLVSHKIDIRDQDPREALLAQAERAAADPMFLGNSYAKTQPKPIFATEEDMAEEDIIDDPVLQKKLDELRNVNKG